MSVLIRLATDKDLNQINSITQAVQMNAWSSASLAAELQHPQGICTVAEIGAASGTTLVGYCLSRRQGVMALDAPGARGKKTRPAGKARTSRPA